MSLSLTRGAHPATGFPQTQRRSQSRTSRSRQLRLDSSPSKPATGSPDHNMTVVRYVPSDNAARSGESDFIFSNGSWRYRDLKDVMDGVKDRRGFEWRPQRSETDGLRGSSGVAALPGVVQRHRPIYVPTEEFHEVYHGISAYGRKYPTQLTHRNRSRRPLVPQERRYGHRSRTGEYEPREDISDNRTAVDGCSSKMEVSLLRPRRQRLIRDGFRGDKSGHSSSQSGRRDIYYSRSDGSSESDSHNPDAGRAQVRSYGSNGVSIYLSPGKNYLLLHEDELRGDGLVKAC